MVDFYDPGIVPPPPFPFDAVRETSKPVEEAPEQPVQEVKAEEPAQETKEQVQEAPKPKYRAVRGSGDPIYLLTPDNKKHWVLSAQVYTSLGYKFGDEEKMENSELATYMPGEAITLENWEKYK